MKQKRLFLFAVVLLVFTISCHREAGKTLLLQKGEKQTSVIQLLQQIDSIGNMGECYTTIAKDYIVKAEDFCNTYPEDPMSADFLYKAGLIAMTIAKITENEEETEFYGQKALSIFEDIQRVYPDYANIKNCILNKGVIYDDILHDYQKAENLYKEFILRYPTDTLAINIKTYLQYIGKTPEEILAEFK
jgi:tetratricopeptide (TPR) repeat protein